MIVIGKPGGQHPGFIEQSVSRDPVMKGISVGVAAYLSAPYLISKGGVEAVAGKAFISFTAQAVVNKGKVNLPSVGSDAIFVPGFSDALGSAFEGKIDLFNLDRGIETSSIFNGKPIKEFGTEASISFLFSAKNQMLNKVVNQSNMKSFLLQTPNAFANYSLQKNFTDVKKNK